MMPYKKQVNISARLSKIKSKTLSYQNLDVETATGYKQFYIKSNQKKEYHQ